MTISADDIIVIAAVDNAPILEACLKRSPDVASGRIPLITIQNARSMADAYNQALTRTTRTICIFAHQDVYLPAGWADRAIARLNGLSERDPTWQVAGPYGVRGDGRHVGRVWDVTLQREIGAADFEPTPIVSLDELVLIVRRDDGFRFDDRLPHFHLYGTDVVQSALARGRSAYVVELPVVHNNRPIASLRGGYQRAYRYARKKWAAKLPIPTTVCDLSHNPFDLWRAQWDRRGVKARPPGLLADAVEIARQAGYE
jgi:hypothetical protein